VPIPGLSDVAAIDAGASHSCAVTTSGDLLCWGANFYGQLGDGTTTDRPTPVSLPLAGVSAVSAGWAHTCAVAGGEVKCWGRNLYGQLGDGAGAWSGGVPVAVNGLPGPVSRVGLGEIHTCALGTSGSVHCWGNNAEGSLGNHSNESSSVPVPIHSLYLPVATAITTFWRRNCALTPDGEPRCWGSGASNFPFAVNTPPPVVIAIGTGKYHSCEIAPGGILYCWGYNSVGQVGNGHSATNHAYPQLVSGGYTLATDVAGGVEHTCAAFQDGNLRCWGGNDWGQLGNGTTTKSTVPVLVAGLSAPAVKVTLGNYFSCALSSVGGVECWGANAGALGDGTYISSSVPVQVAGLASGVVDVAAGAEHACAVTTDGAVFCWGDNYNGELGDGTLIRRNTPVQVVGLDDAVRVGAGDGHSCAVTASGALYCWGRAEWGQLGDGTPQVSSTPVAIAEFEVPDVPALGLHAGLALAVALAAVARRSARAQR
jgi:alpha-tubulin suppressor-like RCC1 family protein